MDAVDGVDEVDGGSEVEPVAYMRALMRLCAASVSRDRARYLPPKLSLASALGFEDNADAGVKEAS
jgi:hypothetical protein